MPAGRECAPSGRLTFRIRAARQHRPLQPLSGVIVPLAPEYNMGGFLRSYVVNAFVSQSTCVAPLAQSLSPAQQQDRGR